MDQLIALIIIWALITFISQLSKKMKKVKQGETMTPEQPTEREPNQLPPIFRDIFNIPEEKQPPGAEEEMPKEETARTIPEPADSPDVFQYRKKRISVPPPLSKPETEPVSLVSQKLSALTISGKYTLKQAVIWKEILDKPVSQRGLRNRGAFQLRQD